MKSDFFFSTNEVTTWWQVLSQLYGGQWTSTTWIIMVHETVCKSMENKTRKQENIDREWW